MTGLLWPGLALLLGCEPSSTDPTDPPPASASIADWVVVECMWQTACDEETLGLGPCMNLVADPDIYGLPAQLEANGLSTRMECLASAKSCADYEACAPSADLVITGPVDSYACPGDRELVCEDGTFLWCLGPDGVSASAGDPPVLAVELETIGKICTPDGTLFVDPKPTGCTSGARFECDGTLLRRCNVASSGSSFTIDCSELDPSFVCWDDDGRARCGLPPGQQRCEPSPDSNLGDHAECEGNVARVCVAGQLYDVDCTKASATCLQMNVGAARCMF